MYDELWCPAEPWVQLERTWMPVRESGYWTWLCPSCGYEEPIMDELMKINPMLSPDYQPDQES